MNVLSLFDGMSCGQLALQRAGIKYDNYFASEIDKYAIKVTMANFPNTIQLGDIRNVKGADLPKIDLLIGGSPCQGFSFAGKQLNFEDPRSKLFFEYVRLLKETNPKYFLLENVRMKKDSQDVISRHLGVEPIMIDSALVSAQSRKRLYWTNIPNITQPENKHITIKDILETDVSIKYVLPQHWQDWYKHNKYQKKRYSFGSVAKIEDINGKTRALCRSGEGDNARIIIINTSNVIFRGHGYLDDRIEQRIKMPSLTSASKNEYFLESIHLDQELLRKLTPTECERLQTVPDNYTAWVSDTQRYNMLGNGWTVDVIAHIFSFMELPAEMKAAV